MNVAIYLKSQLIKNIYIVELLRVKITRIKSSEIKKKLGFKFDL